ncbi:hypothetical protein SCLCIDRAFT_1007888 [Scleroderma citrinum Foug A]|uniref:Uncharacterized protein n=1 Tax=Scleroderma citrinum Foug A TaxID=1036808 RepID=A0A0C3AT85_9AGAM|nr:hypothetical protein SCLCIDRAFT_1007888 [Scleroderma citrinum Foug A]
MAFDPGFLFYDACNQERSQVTCRTYCLFNVQLSANWALYVTGLRPFLRSLWDIQSLVSPTLWQLTTCTSHVPDWESVHPANESSSLDRRHILPSPRIRIHGCKYTRPFASSSIGIAWMRNIAF